MCTIAACLIVRDEEEFIEECLKSLENEVDEIVIVDTGSKDNTIKIAEKYNAKIIRNKWNENFSSARNISIKYAESDWILFIDADERLFIGSSINLRDFLSNTIYDAFSLKIINFLGNSRNSKEILNSEYIRLFRNKNTYYFTGSVHEQILPSLIKDNAKISSCQVANIYHYGYLKDISKKRDKFNRNIKLLKKELKKNQNNAFALFNIAIEYFINENYMEANKYFEASYNLVSGSENYFPRLIRNYIYSLYEAFNFDKAMRLYRQEIKNFEDYTDLWYIGAMLYFSKNQYEEAINNLKICLSLGDCEKYESNAGFGSYKALHFLGQVYLKKNDHNNAIQCFNEGITFYPEILNNFTELGKIYIQKQDYKNAYAVLSKGKEYHKELEKICTGLESIMGKTKFIKEDN